MMIGAMSGDFLCPIELLGEDEANELMRKYQGRKRPDQIGACRERLVDAIGTTDDADYWPAFIQLAL